MTGHAFWDPWFASKTFTTDWTSRAFPSWTEHLAHLRDRPLKILEIGAWEGRGTIFFLNFFPSAHVTTMDLFLLGNEHLFDSNVMAEYPDRVTKLTTRSSRALDHLATRSNVYDLIYVDGSHDRDDVIIDSILAWRLLALDGVMIWDDYELLKAMPGSFVAEQDPKPAIDVFLEWHTNELSVIDAGYQMIVKKVRPHYCVSMLDPDIKAAPQMPKPLPFRERVVAALKILTMPFPGAQQ